ncbi:ubiquinone/menaquinone biosynthesis methyltransferase [Synechococcus sp. RSCCF101]|nr:ubiquinone/menaquinone biosynthesis methyltransferase [Synechococcus sp. RSCCF101]
MSAGAADPASVSSLFNSLSPSYNRLNDAFSLGLHRLWKRRAVAWLAPAPGQRVIDLCCGTGDLALVIAAKLRPGGEVIGIDAAEGPLALAARRSAAMPWLPVRWQCGDALATGLPTAAADAAVMAYGLRNLSDAGLGLREMHRLLRPGGRAAVLDFSHLRPDQLPPGLPRWQAAATAGLQRQMLRRVVVPLSGWAGLSDHYAYLEPSIARFPSPHDLERLAVDSGFRHVRHRPLAGG